MNDESNIKISTFADIVCKKKPSVIQIPVRELYEFNNHPFKVIDDEKMMELVESIKNDGVLVPGIVRPRMGKEGYEIISGHRRKRACEIAGIMAMPVMIKNLDDDQAVIEMVNSNIQREQTLPSEKAFAYKMKFEALTHQGKKLDDGTSTQVGWKLETASQVGELFGDSKNQVRRYIRLTELKNDLLEMVDRKKIKFNPAVELSYLTTDEQEILLDVIEEDDVIPSLIQTQQLKQLSQEGKYTKESVHALLVVSSSKEKKFVLKQDIIKKYFLPDTSDEDIEKVICNLLDAWKKKGRKL